MSNIKNAFKNGKAFIPFITCGDPDTDTTFELVKAISRSGADLIELGIPFSDPTAEGPVIQEANIRALSAGITTDGVFDLVRRLRREVSLPMVFMTYANVVFSYGIERFAETASQAGMDGIILPDVPFEEKEEFAGAFRRRQMDFISLIAPTSHDRIRMIAEKAEGFVYCVSSLGVTGTRERLGADVGAMTELVHKYNPEIPCAVGFGISTPKQAQEMSRCSDGVIVGSAIVKLIAKYGKKSAPYVSEYVREMKNSILIG